MRVTLLVPGTCNLQLCEGSVLYDTRQDRVVISDGDRFGGDCMQIQGCIPLVFMSSSYLIHKSPFTSPSPSNNYGVENCHDNILLRATPSEPRGEAFIMSSLANIGSTPSFVGRYEGTYNSVPWSSEAVVAYV